MSDRDAWLADAHAWLAAQVPVFGLAAREGLALEADLALGRRYMAARFDAGYAGLTLPVELGGQGLSPLHKVLFEDREAMLGMPSGYFGVSTGMPLPILARYAPDHDWARARIVAALRGEEIWCQLFSEPAAGSDLAGLRLRARRADDGGWTLDGQKLWTTFAQYADYGIIVARSDPSLPKHKGLTFFWVDMKAPGVTVSRFRLANGDEQCNEVFFDGVAVADEQRLGPENGGFGVAMATLMIERYAASDADGFGPPIAAFVEAVRPLTIGGRPALEDGRVRAAIAQNHALRHGLEAIRHRAMLAMAAGTEPGPGGSINKLFSVRSRQKLSELALDLQGAAGLAYHEGAYPKADWASSWMGAPSLRLAGGADEMLLNTIAEKILGLPQDHRPDKGVPFDAIVS